MHGSYIQDIRQAYQSLTKPAISQPKYQNSIKICKCNQTIKMNDFDENGFTGKTKAFMKVNRKKVQGTAKIMNKESVEVK